jgi:hypothetical protein
MLRSNKFAALEDFDSEVETISDWEIIRETINNFSKRESRLL